MGQRIIIKTFDDEFDLDTIIAALDEAKHNSSIPCAGLAASLSTVRGGGAPFSGSLLGDLARIYAHATTGRRVDTVRAAYPLLGLQWQTGWNQQDGMIHLIERFPAEAPLLAGLWGKRARREVHGWAPMSLNDLFGDKTPEQKLTETGIEGPWKMMAVYGTHSTTGDPQPPGPNALTFKVGDRDHQMVITTTVFTRYYVQDLAERTAWGVLWLLFPVGGSKFRNFLLVLADECTDANAPYAGQVIGSGFVSRTEQWEKAYKVRTDNWSLR